MAGARRPHAGAPRSHSAGTGELTRQRLRAQALGAELLLDRFDDPEEPLYVLADSSGHPFCLFAVSEA
ncbi:VOC family protein [Streptomyces sp. NPDC057367]|uniref:VOC family protein n=1 Tax=Streptomyces sp. NPDC057367 TaxID=3346108 RepID=UPI0036383B84